MESNGDVDEQKSSCTQNRLRKEPLFGAIYLVAVAALPLPVPLDFEKPSESYPGSYMYTEKISLGVENTVAFRI